MLDGFCAIAATGGSASANSAQASFNACFIGLLNNRCIVDYGKGRSSEGSHNEHHDEDRNDGLMMDTNFSHAVSVRSLA
jgi:hypothetical protein